MEIWKVRDEHENFHLIKNRGKSAFLPSLFCYLPPYFLYRNISLKHLSVFFCLTCLPSQSLLNSRQYSFHFNNWNGYLLRLLMTFLNLVYSLLSSPRPPLWCSECGEHPLQHLLFTASPPYLYLQVLLVWIQLTSHWKYLGEKVQKFPKKQKLNLLHFGNYLHSIYIAFTTIYIEFALYLQWFA